MLLLCVLMVGYCSGSVFWWCGIALALCSDSVVCADSAVCSDSVVCSDNAVCSDSVVRSDSEVCSEQCSMF